MFVVYFSFVYGFLVSVFARDLILDYGILSSMSFLIECLCMTLLTLAVMVMRGFTFSLLFRWVILIVLCVRAWLGNLSTIL